VRAKSRVVAVIGLPLTTEDGGVEVAAAGAPVVTPPVGAAKMMLFDVWAEARASRIRVGRGLGVGVGQRIWMRGMRIGDGGLRGCSGS